MRPFSSLVTTASSNSSVEYIQQIENEIIEPKEAGVKDQEEQARDQEERAISKKRSKRIFINF